MRRFLMAMVIGGLVASGHGGVTTVARADEGVNITTVEGDDTDSYLRYFRAGEIITIEVRGDGNADLDLFVLSPCNQVVAKDDDETDHCKLRFRALQSGFYNILVKNCDSRRTVYTIAVSGGTCNPK
jgi:hypothetical protein